VTGMMSSRCSVSVIVVDTEQAALFMQRRLFRVDQSR